MTLIKLLAAELEELFPELVIEAYTNLIRVRIDKPAAMNGLHIILGQGRYEIYYVDNSQHHQSPILSASLSQPGSLDKLISFIANFFTIIRAAPESNQAAVTDSHPQPPHT